jgi:hypothetical protein
MMMIITILLFDLIFKHFNDILSLLKLYLLTYFAY